MSDRVDEIERAICEKHWPASKVFTQMKQVIQSLNAEIESLRMAYGIINTDWGDMRAQLYGAMEENAELRREVERLREMIKGFDRKLIVE